MPLTTPCCLEFLSLNEPVIISGPGEGKAACANGETREGVDSPMLNRLMQYVPGSGLYCANNIANKGGYDSLLMVDHRL